MGPTIVYLTVAMENPNFSRLVIESGGGRWCLCVHFVTGNFEAITSFEYSFLNSNLKRSEYSKLATRC